MASSSLKWLPPLRYKINRLRQETISMEIYQTEPFGSDESLSDGIINVSFESCVDFVLAVPDPRVPNFRGLAIQHSFSTTNLNSIIEHSRRYFPVAGKLITWTEKHCDGDQKSEVLKITERILPSKIHGFLKEAMEKEYNKGTSKNVQSLKLKISRENVIDDRQLVEWHAWYAQMVHIDPGFEKEWNKNISRLRTREELQNETRLPLVPRFHWEFERWRGECCPICLDEFSVMPNCRAVKPPCGHMFHKDCILKWFYRGPLGIKCPTCRSDNIPRYEYAYVIDWPWAPSSLRDYIRST